MRLDLRGVQLRAAEFELTIDCSISGGVTALFGHSGAGKTTLIELVAGLRAPDAGCIVLDGRILTEGRRRLVPTRERRIGYVPQESLLFPHLSVRENLAYGLTGSSSGHEKLELILETLEITGLEQRDVRTLSGGERRRVALGRALLTDPKLLLLDEPLAALERALQKRLLVYLRRIRDELQTPMVYVTHVAEEVEQLAERVIVLEAGRIVESGAPAEVFSRRSDAADR